MNLKDINIENYVAEALGCKKEEIEEHKLVKKIKKNISSVDSSRNSELYLEITCSKSEKSLGKFIGHNYSVIIDYVVKPNRKKKSFRKKIEESTLYDDPFLRVFEYEREEHKSSEISEYIAGNLVNIAMICKYLGIKLKDKICLKFNKENIFGSIPKKYKVSAESNLKRLKEKLSINELKNYFKEPVRYIGTINTVRRNLGLNAGRTIRSLTSLCNHL